MSQLKILFADDQIIPDNIVEDEIERWINTRYPSDQWDSSFIKAFKETRKTVERLKRDGYDVTLARTITEAESLIQKQCFDIVIIDLGWAGDLSIPDSDRGYKGWYLSSLVDKMDHINQTQTRQIIYSIKFLKDPELSRIAANKGKLPVFKSESSGEEGRESLMAAISFIKSMMNMSTPKSAIDKSSHSLDNLGTKVNSNFSIQVPTEVFIVHGHDNEAKEKTARFVESLGLKAIVLHEQPNKGQTIIEKFESSSAEVGFAIVLLTPDDMAAPKDSPDNRSLRARQNVILELGYFLRALGRDKVCVLYKQGVEIPSDYLGVAYISLDDSDGWRLKLANEMKQAGLNINLNNVI